MEFIKKEREKLEELSKEAMIALSIKDDIINDLKIQLDLESQENTNLRLKVKELESKLVMIDENLDLDDEKLRSSLNSKKSSTFNKNFFKNLQGSDENKQDNHDYNVRNLIEESKILFEENNNLREKIREKDVEIDNLNKKTQRLQELEALNHQKIEAQRIKLEQSEIFLNQVKERESYIDELITRYKTIENEYENSVIVKDIEIKNLQNKVKLQEENIESLTNQINFYSQNSNNMTQDLIREIRLLEERNKELDMKLYKSEFTYQEEIKSLHRSLQESESKFMRNQKENKQEFVSQSCHLPEGKEKNPADMKVEDLTKSVSKSIQEKVDSQSKLIANQNIEIINLKYEKERLSSDLALEKDTNQKLQQSLAEQKYKISSSKKVECEEGAMQTVLKSSDLEQDKRRIKVLEQENNDLTDKIFLVDRENCALKEKITSLGGENNRLCNELNLIIRKNDRKKATKFDNLDQDLLYNISNISKLQTTISQMKIREIELLDRIQDYEKLLNHIKDNNNINNIEQVPYFNINNLDNKAIPNNQPYSAKSNTSPNFNSTGPLQQTRFFSSGLNMNSTLTHSKNIKEESNILVSFNVSEESIERERGQVAAKTNNILKPQGNSNIEIELKRLSEDNMYLKEQNFKYVSELQRLQDSLNFFKLQLTNKDEEMEVLYKEKQILVENLNNINAEMERRTDNSAVIEEFKTKLKGFTEMNSQLNDQFIQLQQRFNAQKEIVTQKNTEISELIGKLQNLEAEKKELIDILEENNKKMNQKQRENDIVKNQAHNFELEKDNMDRYINDTLQKNEQQITQLENKLEAVISDNTKLCEVNNKLKGKVKELYEELRNKEDTLKFIRTNSENDEILKKEILDIRRENESLLQMKQELKLENNDLKYEVKLLKEKLCYHSNVLESKSSGNHSKLSSSFENSVMTNIPSVKKHRTKINYNQINDETNMLKEENHKLSVELEDYKNKLYQKENELRILNDKIQTTELEKTRIKAKSESDLECLVNELNIIKGNNENLAEIHKFLEEIKEKNQTISHLIEEKTHMKNEMLVMKDNHEFALKNYAVEFDSVKENLDKVQDDFQKYRENMEIQLGELRKSFDDNIEETSNLKKECEEYKKEKIDLSILLEDKISHYEKVIKESQSEFNQIFEERKGLVYEIKEITIQHCKDYERLKEKLSKNKEKFEIIIQTYENHITFLQQRFKNHVNELLIALNQKSMNKDFNLERFIKNLDNVTSMINDISQRESAIESFKIETKQQKKSMKNLTNNMKKLVKENEELKEQLNIKSLQKKINVNPTSNNKEDDVEILRKLLNLKEILQENTAARLEEQKQAIQLKNKDNEIRLLKLKLENNEKNQFEIDNALISKENELKQKEAQITELQKNYKNDLHKLTEEILHIKEKWVTPEKWLETVNQISNLEKTIKSQKEDINRKKDLINHLKSSNENQANTKPVPNNEGEIVNLNEKIKALNKELTRTQNYVKELKQSNDNLKGVEKKSQEEINSLTEKVKILKIDLTRKEEMLKNFKDKINVDETSNKNKAGQTDEVIDKLKKAKLEGERKEMTIKTLKAKLDTNAFEIEQLKTQNLKLSKSSMNEVDKELKLHEINKSKADSYQSYAENLISVLKRIFKDIVTHYESLRNKFTGERNDTYNRFKEALEILNMKENELNDISYEKRIDIYEKIMKMLGNSNYFDVSQIVESFINLKEKIINYYRCNPNSISDNLHTYSNSTIDLKPVINPISKYENFLSKIKDNSKNNEVINDMENLMKNLKYLNDNK